MNRRREGLVFCRYNIIFPKKPRRPIYVLRFCIVRLLIMRNLILDCLEKRSNLLWLLTEFVRKSGIKTMDDKTRDGDLLNGIAHYIKRYDGPHEELKIERLAKMANNNQRYFIAKFKKRFGKTPMQYAADVRLDKARDYLDGTSLSIGEIARILAFDDPKYFSKFFKRRTGQTPTEYRKSRGK